jgi:hypothetical protein
MGTIFRRVWLDALQALHRFPRGPAVVSYGRLGTCAQASAGKRYGPSGKTRGKADLKGACSAAAVRLLRQQAAAQTLLAR